jgi:hypothetical protein
MTPEKKRWLVEYDHKDGRKGTVEATTEISESSGFHYGNGKCGYLQVDDFGQGYDLRYNHDKDLHTVMLREFFGEGLVKATEI